MEKVEIGQLVQVFDSETGKYENFGILVEVVRSNERYHPQVAHVLIGETIEEYYWIDVLRWASVAREM